MRKLIAMSNRPKRAEGHTLIRCNGLYEALGIPTVDYDELFYPPYAGMQRMDPSADLDRWAQQVQLSWVPETVEMFGQQWNLAECGYDPQRK